MELPEAIKVLNEFEWEGHDQWHQVGLWAEPDFTPEGDGRIVEQEAIRIAESLLASASENNHANGI